jgi:hypothetical protein
MRVKATGIPSRNYFITYAKPKDGKEFKNMEMKYTRIK